MGWTFAGLAHDLVSAPLSLRPPRKRGGRRKRPERPAVEGGLHPKDRNEVKDPERQAKGCGLPRRA
jgi:hypothetical protein